MSGEILKKYGFKLSSEKEETRDENKGSDWMRPTYVLRCPALSRLSSEQVAADYS